jgi:hypothetical protein
MALRPARPGERTFDRLDEAESQYFQLQDTGQAALRQAVRDALGSLQNELQRSVQYLNGRAAAEEARANDTQLRATEREIAREQAGRYRAMSQEIGVGALTVGVIRGLGDHDLVRGLNQFLDQATQRATAYRDGAQWAVDMWQANRLSQRALRVAQGQADGATAYLNRLTQTINDIRQQFGQ